MQYVARAFDVLNTLLDSTSPMSVPVGSGVDSVADRYLDDLLVRRLALPYMVELQANDIADRPWTATLSVAVGAKSAVIERIWTTRTPLDLVLAVGDTLRAAGGVGMSKGEDGLSLALVYDRDR